MVVPARARGVLMTLVVPALCFLSVPSDAQECRGGATPRIVGGDTAQLKHWPGQAVLRSNNAGDIQYFCGGSAINESWVLTAAHCVAKLSADELANTEVVLGVDDLDKVSKNNVYNIAKVVVHDGYTQPQISGLDLALIKLKRTYRGAIARLSLEAATDPQTPPGAQVRVAGFGLLKDSGTLQRFRRSDGQEYYAGSKRLLETSVPTVSEGQCKAHYSGEKIGEGQVCAGLEKGGQDSCRGDSGGPLVAYDRKGCPYQIGVVSWGYGCAGPNDYGVYSKVSYHAAWLTGLAGSLSHMAINDVETTTTPAVVSSLRSGATSQLEELLPRAKGKVRIGVKGGNRIALGKEVVFTVSSDVGGQLIVIDVNASGEVLQIFPNEFASAQMAHISPGVDFTIPGPGYGFTGFQAKEPVGKGQLLALVVPENFPIENILGSAVKARGFEPVNTPTSYLMNLVQRVARIAGDRSGDGTQMASWGLGAAAYEIVK